jgi:hypothetical protein
MRSPSGGSSQKSSPVRSHAPDASGKNTPPHDLKGRTMRGALVSTVGQGANFVLRKGSMVVLARLLTAEEFGLAAMVIACTGFLDIFRDFGLSMAAVQRTSISQAQYSTLFGSAPSSPLCGRGPVPAEVISTSSWLSLGTSHNLGISLCFGRPRNSPSQMRSRRKSNSKPRLLK